MAMNIILRSILMSLAFLVIMSAFTFLVAWMFKYAQKKDTVVDNN